MKFNIDTSKQGINIQFSLNWQTARASVIGLLGLLSMPQLLELARLLGLLP